MVRVLSWYQNQPFLLCNSFHRYQLNKVLVRTDFTSLYWLPILILNVLNQKIKIYRKFQFPSEKENKKNSKKNCLRTFLRSTPWNEKKKNIRSLVKYCISHPFTYFLIIYLKFIRIYLSNH